MYDDIRRVLDDIKNNWKGFYDRIQFASSKFFYKSEFISDLIFHRNFKNLPKSEFIDYNRAFQYYESNRKKVTIIRKGELKEIEIPYQEIINYIHTPETSIKLASEILEYTLKSKTLDESEIAFNEFIKQRPQTHNGEILRISHLEKSNNGQFLVNLEKAKYFDLIRTNLTLDFPLKYDNFSSLRIEDLDKENNLLPFRKSSLVNSIGVSTVLTYRKKGSFYYYMKPRKGNLGIFNDMLGSISGVVEPPKILDENFELTSYVKNELLRELQEETGLEIQTIKDNPQFKIIPLAFTRELLRGGKPQFFFLIMIDEISEKAFNEIFNKSEGKKEFKDNWFDNIKSFDDFISPEFTTNLIYAKEYIQKRQKKEIKVLELD